MDRRSRSQTDLNIPWGYILAAILLVIMLWLAFSPPRFWINLTKRVDLSEPVRTGEVLVNRYDCRNCHNIGGSGGWVAPSLVGVTSSMEEETLRMWLRDPSSVDGPTAMPDFTLSDTEIEAIVAFLEALDGNR
jgi:mono/diheme cytochrome c family protein